MVTQLSLPSVLVALTAGLSAQIAPQRALVAVHNTSAPASALFEVDLATGAIAAVGRFAADGLSPLAVAVDELNRDLIVVLDLGGGSLVERIRLSGLTVISERVLGTIPGIVTDLAFGHGLIAFTVGGANGGVWTLPRNGGPATRLGGVPRATAAYPSVLWGQITIVQSGAPPATDPQLFRANLVTGQISGPYGMMAGYRPFRITGHVSFLAGFGYNYFANDDGTVSAGLSFLPPAPLSLTPALGPGAAIAMRSRLSRTGRYSVVVLGDRRHPFLKTFQPFALRGTLPWRTLAGPLPGDPVDFWVVVSPGSWLWFGRRCGAGGHLQVSAGGGEPWVGNQNYYVSLQFAPPGQLVALALGVSDQSFGPLPLPLLLPGGCSLLVSVELDFVHTTSAIGQARQPIPIPNDPRLAGAIVYAQWFLPQAGGLATSQAAAIFIN